MELGIFTQSQTITFLAAVFALLVFSRRSLLKPRSHGFFRLLTFIAIAGVIIPNINYWHIDLLTPRQLLSWAILLLSLLFVCQGYFQLSKSSERRDSSINRENFNFENTAKLIDDGIYQYICHPMYSSLLFLTWGSWLKQPTIIGTATAIIASIFLMLTIRTEELENIAYFGKPYKDYLRKTKKIIPFIY